MISYWMMFAIPAFAAPLLKVGSATVQRLVWWGVGLLFTLLIGLRYQVGADWGNYLDFYDRVLWVPLQDAMKLNDPGYMALNWLAGLVGGEIYLVNLACGAVMMAGLVTFARRQPLPWLALLVAVPYIIIVTAMGYTRQSVALGFELLALVALMDAKLRRFVFFIICGALFHKSAMLLLPLAFLASSRNRVWTLMWVSLTGAAMGVAILFDHYEILWQNYVKDQMVSEGGPIRVAMNALPAALLLLFRKRLMPDGEAGRLWFWMAVFSLACIPLVALASTAVDRVALYFMPIQLYVFSGVHRLFDDRLFKTVAVVSVVLGYGLVQWVWLNFAIHAFAWLPYQFYPLVGL